MAYKALKIDTREIGTSEYFDMVWDSIVNGETEFSDKDGNKKLNTTKETIYYIWNLPTYITCPFATEDCKKACYAMDPEENYCMSSVNKARYKNLAMCTGDNAETFVDRMIARLEKLFNSKKYKSRKNIRVRIHESGDFFSKEYAKQWIEIAMHFNTEEYSNVVFMAYTKSLPFFDGVQIPGNFVLRSSIWQDTNESMIAMTEKNGYPLYMAIPDSMESYAINKGFIKCDCENCSTCEKHCFTMENKNMFVLLHGKEAKNLEAHTETIKAIIDRFS